MTVDTHRLRALLESAGLDGAAAQQRAEQIALLAAHGEPLDAQARELIDKLARRMGSAETAAIQLTPPGTEATMASPALGVDSTWKGEPALGFPEAPADTLPPPGPNPPGGRSSLTIEPGERVDQYEVIRPIGKGGMGAVYLARDVLLGRKVALKVVHPNLLASAGAVDRFLFEARATASFNHPNIVAIYGLGQVHGCPYVALEYLPGNSLRERLREGPLAVGETVEMARCVAEALAEAHRQGLLHCDLKPENVFLPRDGRLRVLDFGLARLVARAPALGTPDASAGPDEGAAGVDD